MCRVAVKDEIGIVAWGSAGTGMVVFRPGARMHVPFWAKKASLHIAVHAWHDWASMSLQATALELDERQQQIADLTEMVEPGVL